MLFCSYSLLFIFCESMVGFALRLPWIQSAILPAFSHSWVMQLAIQYSGWGSLLHCWGGRVLTYLILHSRRGKPQAENISLAWAVLPLGGCDAEKSQTVSLSLSSVSKLTVFCCSGVLELHRTPGPPQSLSVGACLKQHFLGSLNHTWECVDLSHGPLQGLLPCMPIN